MKNEPLLDYNPESQEEALKMAGFGMRWGALLVDLNILIFVLVFFSTKLSSIIKKSGIDFTELSESAMVGTALVYLFGAPIISILYQALFDSSHLQGTPGKIAVKIKVTDIDGNRISFLRALARNASKILSSLIFYIGFFMAIWTNKRQTLHDMIANTYVVRRD